MSPCLPVFQWLLFFFPLAGDAGAFSAIDGRYWSCDADAAGTNCHRMAVYAQSAVVDQSWYEGGLSVRCVRAREGQAIPCFFPLAGWAGEPSAVTGNYWTAQIPQYDPGQGYLLTLDGPAAGASAFTPWASAVSVRCVRAREEQAVPLFWIVWF